MCDKSLDETKSPKVLRTVKPLFKGVVSNFTLHLIPSAIYDLKDVQYWMIFAATVLLNHRKYLFSQFSQILLLLIPLSCTVLSNWDTTQCKGRWMKCAVENCMKLSAHTIEMKNFYQYEKVKATDSEEKMYNWVCGGSLLTPAISNIHQKKQNVQLGVTLNKVHNLIICCLLFEIHLCTVRIAEINFVIIFIRIEHPICCQYLKVLCICGLISVFYLILIDGVKSHWNITSAAGAHSQKIPK